MTARAVAAACLALALSGCELEDALVPGPVTVCTEPGAQCQLEGGPLGVCEQLACPAGQPSPCFKCVPQH